MSCIVQFFLVGAPNVTFSGIETNGESGRGVYLLGWVYLYSRRFKSRS